MQFIAWIYSASGLFFSARVLEVNAAKKDPGIHLFRAGCTLKGHSFCDPSSAFFSLF